MFRLAPMLLLLALSSIAASCGGQGAGDGDGRRVVTVFAAASLSDVFAELETVIETAEPGIDVRLSFAGSSTLREQILDGAPADVFASANESVMDDVVDAGAASAPIVFATNHLVIATPAENTAGVAGLEDFERSDLLIGVCSPDVPCGSAADAVFDAAGVVPSLDTEEPDVRRLLAKIVDGELDAGLVYATDAIAAGGAVAVFDLPADVGSSSRYSIAVLDEASDAGAASTVVDFIVSADGHAVLSSSGFGS